MGKLVKLYKKMQGGGDPNRPIMQQATTAVIKRRPSATNTNESSVLINPQPGLGTPDLAFTDPVLTRDQRAALTKNPNFPYTSADLANQQRRTTDYNDKIRSKYESLSEPNSFLKIKDSKYNIRNNEAVKKPIIDDIVKASVKNNIDPYLALSMGQRESGLGNFSAKGDTKSIRKDNPYGIFSDWYGSTDQLDVKSKNGGLSAKDYNRAKSWADNRTQYPFQQEMKDINTLTKNGTNIRGYNPGDPTYPNKVAQDREILMAPENKPFRKYVDSVTNVAKQELPKMTNGGSIEPPGTLTPKAFLKAYLESPNYKKRLQLQDYKEPEQTIKDRLQNLVTTPVTTKQGQGNEFNNSTKLINIDKQEINKYNLNPDNTMLHELSHSIGSMGYAPITKVGDNSRLNNNEINLLNSNNKSTNPHDQIAGERKADLDVLRYNLKKDGIYDTGTQEFNQVILDKAKQKYQKDSTVNRNFKAYTDKDLINLMNKVAVNSTNQEQLPIAANGGDISNMKKKLVFPSMKKMDDGGIWQSANQWATNNQKGISAVGDYGAATVDAFAPKDAYGVRSNGAALGSGALSGASKGAAVGSMFGPEGTLIGAGAGAIVGGVSGLLGNEKANRTKIQAIDTSTRSQLMNDQQMADARVAGDPGLKYGRMSASYYRFGGVMKNSPAVLPRTTKPLPAIQAKPRLMPNITESPNRQMSHMANGGYSALPNAIHSNASRLSRPVKPMKAQKNQILADGGSIHINPANKGKFNATKAATGKSTEELTHSSNPVTKKRAIFAQNASHWNKKADGGQVEQLSSQDAVVNGPSHENGGVKFPSAGVELEGGETVNNGFVFSKKLGFAKPAEAIARQLGKAEKRPETAINTSTINALQRKTELLKVHQETAKQAVGIPSDLPKMADGGNLPDPQVPQQGRPLKQVDIKGNKPVYVKDKNDPRLRAYQDSLALHNLPNPLTQPNTTKGDPYPGGHLPAGKEGEFNRQETIWNKAHEDLQSMGKTDRANLKPIDRVPGNWGFGPYDAPKQPVVYRAASTKPVYKKPLLPAITPKQQPDNILDTAGKDPTKPLSSTNPLMVQKEDGTTGVWGNPIAPDNTKLPVITKPTIVPSDKARGTSDTYYPARDQMKGKTPDAIPRPYKFGGKIKKMADGGDPEDGVVINDMRNPNAGPFWTGLGRGPQAPPVFATTIGDKGTYTPTPVTDPSTSSNKFNDIAGKLVPFASNFANATQKLPLPPVPQLNTEITPNLVDYSASRNEAVRANRSANASARTNLNSGAAVSATQAANLAGQTRAVSQINEAENNQNASIRNSTAAENAQIRAGNTALQNNYQNELVQRQIKGQSLKSANMANLEEKVQGMSRDKKMFDLEGEKTILGFLSNNNTGAGYDTARPILQKHLSEDQLNRMDAWATKARQNDAEDRADNMKANKLQLDYLKNKNLNTKGILNGTSAISSGKMKRSGTETETDKEGNKTIKKTSALYN